MAEAVLSRRVSEGCECLYIAEGIHPVSDPRIRKRLRFESALEVSWSNPLLKAGLASWLDQLAQGLTQPSFEDLRGWRSTTSLGNLPQCSTPLAGDNFFLMSN